MGILQSYMTSHTHPDISYTNTNTGGVLLHRQKYIGERANGGASAQEALTSHHGSAPPSCRAILYP